MIELTLRFDDAEQANDICDALPRAMALLRSRRYDELKAELVEKLHAKLAGAIDLAGIDNG